MNEVYVLTNESNENLLLGVYTNEVKAIQALLQYAKHMSVGKVEVENVGARYTFYCNDGPAMVCYIERCELNEPLLYGKYHYEDMELEDK